MHQLEHPQQVTWENKIKVNKLPSGYYDYDEKSVYEYLLKTTGKPVKGKLYSMPGSPPTNKKRLRKSD